MRRLLAALAASVLCLGLAAAEANPIPGLRGGVGVGGGGGSGTVFAVDPLGTGVRADHAAGQTFVQWPDVQVTGAVAATVTDYTKRYRVHRNTTARATDAASCASGTKIGSFILPNSGQLIGGNPDTAGAAYTQANRTDDHSPRQQPMAKTPDMQLGGTPSLAYATGLQVYKALAPGDAYYCVLSTDTSDAGAVFIGAVGPIAESVATPQPILFTHRTVGNFHITYDGGGNPIGTAGLPVVFQAHASSGSGGIATNAAVGDYWEMFGDTSEGWQDGVQRAFDLYKDGAGASNFPSLSGGALVYGNRDTIWNPAGTGAMETDHFGLGMTPNPLVGVANRHYPTTFNSIQRQLTWICSSAFYHADCNQAHMTGVSMGAWAGAVTGVHMTSPRFASVWMAHPVFRMDLWGTSIWSGVTWVGGWPFTATVAAAPNTLGTNSAVVLRSDGSSWLDFVNFATSVAADPSADLPFFGGMDTKDDANLASSGAASWTQIITGLNALQNAHRGMCFVSYMGGHTTGSDAMGACNADWGSAGADAIVGVAYGKGGFALNLPYIAFDHSSDNDNFGTATRDATTNIYDGDMVGCWECGHTWNVTSDTVGGVAFTVGDTWMTRSPTVLPSTQIATLGPLSANTGTGTFTLVSATGFLATNSGNKNDVLLIGSGANAEIVFIGAISGTSVPISGRGVSGTTGKVHSVGDPVVQLVSKPTGPNGGPFASITTNLTPRRLQNFKPVSAPSCTYQAFGDISPTSATVSYLGNGVFTLTGITINSGGNTSVVCS